MVSLRQNYTHTNASFVVFYTETEDSYKTFGCVKPFCLYSMGIQPRLATLSKCPSLNLKISLRDFASVVIGAVQTLAKTIVPWLYCILFLLILWYKYPPPLSRFSVRRLCKLFNERCRYGPDGALKALTF